MYVADTGTKRRTLFLPWCVQKGLPCPKPTTIGNLIKDMGGLRLCPVRLNRNGKTVVRKKAKKSRKPKQFVATHPGHCVALDTVERFIEGNRRYIITFTDLASRFSLAWATEPCQPSLPVPESRQTGGTIQSDPTGLLK